MSGSLERKMQELRTQLQSRSKEDLIERIIQLEKRTVQLQNLLKKSNDGESTENHKLSKNKSRPFNFSKATKRHILLRFFYLGWDYQGFAAQEDTTQTIEHHLFQALQKTCLIESRESSNYHRCGRTDKGVSAFFQVISIDVRSKLTQEQIASHENLDQELPYCTLLNRVLPPEIQCVAWMPLNNPLYSARFDCKQRTYRYIFPVANLDLKLMREAAEYLIGVHDFRNLCKMDINNGVTTFIRSISRVEIKPVESSPESSDDVSGYQLFYLEIESQAFLWHQIRCIVAALLLVGMKLEQPQLVKELLDIDTNPCKPNYHMASHLPLNLYKCEFRDRGESRPEELEESQAQPSDLTEWKVDEFNLQMVIETLQGQWCSEAVKTAIIKMMLGDLEELYKTKFPGRDPIIEQANVLRDEKKSKTYKPLMSRQTCQSLEERIEIVEAKKRRVDVASINTNLAMADL